MRAYFKACRKGCEISTERMSALQQKGKTSEKILPFVRTYNPAVSNREAIVTRNWSFIQNQPLLTKIKQNCEWKVSDLSVTTNPQKGDRAGLSHSFKSLLG